MKKLDTIKILPVRDKITGQEVSELHGSPVFLLPAGIFYGGQK
jgi:hypothetical protein